MNKVNRLNGKDWDAFLFGRVPSMQSLVREDFRSMAGAFWILKVADKSCMIKGHGLWC